MALGIAVVAIWVYLLVGRGMFWLMREAGRIPPAGTDSADALPARLPSIVAVIPARNEAAVVEKALESLAGQDYPGAFHIVLVDDHSEDGTAEVARAAARAEKLTIVHAAPLAKGWTGKMWAVAEGVRVAARREPDYLLLTDADIVHAPGELQELAARAETGYDMVSYMATLHCESLAERALVPAFVFFFFMLYPPAWGRGAAGGCMLVRREMLERIGGVAAVGGELIDDCALARVVRRGGGRVWMGPSAGTRSIRAYGTFAEIGRMISRSAFAQLRHSAWLLAAVAAGLLLTFAVPPVLALCGSWWGAFAWAAMSLMYMPVLRFYRVSPLWAPVLPLIALYYLGATFDSAILHWRGKGGMWKGRAFQG
jgi:hopene-associated glycosyltransferase HpnB